VYRDGVSVRYGGAHGLEIAARVWVCPTIKPGGIRSQTRVWHSKARSGVCIPLPYMLAVVCCGIPRLGAEPSMVVRLWK
jgi:hypothetical protein